jgi:hypothetical protein
VRRVIAGHRLTYPDRLPESLDALFLRAMAKDPDDRPTFAEIVEEMDSASAGEVVYADLRTFGTATGGEGTLQGGDNDLAEFREV